MIKYPAFDPVAFTLGPLNIRWYGLMYILGFVAAWLLARSRALKAGSGWTVEQVDDLVTYSVFGVILGGRLGYTLFYETSYFLNNPLDIFKIWNGGMSFHGGLLGVIIAIWLFARHTGKSLFEVGDFTAPLVAPGLLAGRLGNFINGELWGRHTSAEWGMVFPGAGPLPRHPSQLYEAALEGVALFIILWLFSAKPRPRMAVSGMFLLLYGSFRFFVEFFREPDLHLGYLAFGWVTMGQILCLPMILGGLVLVGFAMKNEKQAALKTE
jgi:phosphatidylglycerol:prolipoprotein diacylglycerol transferase